MKTTSNNNRENMNAANTGASNNNKINDFGQKIGGARKDLYTAAREWAEKLADTTAEALKKAGGVSKLVRLPNLESMTAAGAITADQARAALIIWRGIERKPSGSYRADRWAERTRARLEAAAAVITGTEPTADDVRDIITAARESAELATLTAANWPAEPFTFGKYSVIRCRYSNVPKLQIQDAHYYRGTASEDPADIVRQLREMTAADAEKAADRRAAGPALSVFVNRAGVYFIAPADRSEIVLQTYEDRAAALKAYHEDRAALVARYTALKNFPACRRDWNRPRVGEDWREGENMTPEKFAEVLPFRGVEFGNWVNQTERAALLNSAFDGFHDLAAVLNIAPAAVTLNGSLSFAFASRGHSGAAAHYEPARRVINLTKKNGAGCMAHEWFHAVDNFAAGGGAFNYATERRDHPAAFAILEAIKRTDYYRRSQNLAQFKGDYWTEGRELTARAFEGVCAVMLNAAGICSDFLVNCKSMDEFAAEDVAHRSDYYPYPTADEAAALLPLYVAFLREVFGDVLTAPAACYEEAKRAAARAEEQRKEAERIAAERAEAERQERERKAAELREKAAREAEQRRQASANTVEMLREVLTARHLDTIATAYDSAAVYAVAHLEGEIYTISADIKTANEQGRAYIESRPAACVQYKRVHNAKRIICRRYQVPEIRANKWNARELCEALSMTDARDIVRTFANFEKADTWKKAAKLWEDTQRLHEEQSARTSEKPAKPSKESTQTNEAPAEGLQLIDTAAGVAVIGNDWKDTYFNKRQIKAHGAKWNKEAKQWEATDPADVASLRAWFALREAHTESTPAATLEDAGEISVKMCERIYNDTAAPVAIGNTVIYNKFKGETPRRAVVTGYNDTIKMYFLETEDGQNIATGRDGFAVCGPESSENEPAAVALPEWLTVGARVRTRGRFMMSTHGRPEWVEGEEMTVKAINADFVELESRDESGTLRGLESVATATAADELTPIYSASEISQPAESEPAAVAASIDTNEPEPHTESTESTESTPTRAKAQTYQDKPDADTLPDDLPADVLKFYEVNRDASDENPAPVCLFWHNNTHSYTAYGSDAHILRDELGKGCATFTTETEYKHGKRFPAPIDFADIERDELPAALHWLTREGYAVAVFVAADCLPTLDPAAPDWQERDRARRDLRYSERLELGDGVTRIMESERNMYDCHYNIQYRYYRNGELLALFNATGYPEKWDVISTLRPPHAGYFSTGRNVAYFGTIYEAERFMLAEIAQGLQPYHRPTDPTPDPSGEGVGVCHSYDTNQDTATLQDAGEITDTAKTEPTRNQEIAKIILQQLGGRQFAMMTGAKQFVAIDNGVRFRIGRNATRANLVKIVLRGDDTYNMEFWLIGQEVNPYTILMRYANKGLSEEEFNKQVKAATERAEKAAESVKLKAYEGIYCDQLQELFTQYTELYTRLF